MFILLINYVVMSYRRCKGTAVLGDGEIFAGLLPEVVATGAAICDNLQESCRIVSQCSLK
jgi:hypothetical protein